MTTVTVDSSDEEVFSSDEEGEGDERAGNMRSSPPHDNNPPCATKSRVAQSGQLIRSEDELVSDSEEKKHKGEEGTGGDGEIADTHENGENTDEEGPKEEEKETKKPGAVCDVPHATMEMQVADTHEDGKTTGKEGPNEGEEDPEEPRAVALPKRGQMREKKIQMSQGLLLSILTWRLCKP
jgi:hypothetical protein